MVFPVCRTRQLTGTERGDQEAFFHVFLPVMRGQIKFFVDILFRLSLFKGDLSQVYRQISNSSNKTKAFLNLHSYLPAVFLFQVTLPKFPVISPSSFLSALPSFSIPEFPFCYSNSPSIICLSLDISCPCPFFSINCAQDVFNFGLLPNT